MSVSAANCSSEERSSRYRMTRHGLFGSMSPYYPAITTFRSERLTLPNAPSTMRHDSAKSHSPYVEPVVSFMPPCIRHGQIASQLHASKYVPDTRHSLPCCFT